MSSLNKVTLIGSVGKDPEIRYNQSGEAIASLSIATNESWKDKATGEKKERTEWHNIVIFNKGLVSIAQNFVKKGNKIYIEGMLQTRKWQDKEGRDKYTTEIVLKNFAGNIILLGGKSSSPTPHLAAKTSVQSPVDMDDEIPF